MVNGCQHGARIQRDANHANHGEQGSRHNQGWRWALVVEKRIKLRQQKGNQKVKLINIFFFLGKVKNIGKSVQQEYILRECVARDSEFSHADYCRIPSISWGLDLFPKHFFDEFFVINIHKLATCSSAVSSLSGTVVLLWAFICDRIIDY